MGASRSKLVTYKFTPPIKHILLHLEQFIEFNLSMFTVVNEHYNILHLARVWPSCIGNAKKRGIVTLFGNFIKG